MFEYLAKGNQAILITWTTETYKNKDSTSRSTHLQHHYDSRETDNEATDLQRPPFHPCVVFL